MIKGEITAGIEVEASSGNVFEDLGHPVAEEKLVKADLSIEIARAIRDRNLTQGQAARVLGCSQPDVSNLTRGQLRGFTIERLLGYLTALGLNVQIVLKPAALPRGRFAVLYESDPVRGIPAKSPAEGWTMSNRRLVYERGDGSWVNKRDTNHRASSLHRTQGEAVAAAKQMLKNSGGGELVTHGRDGKIRSRDTIAPRNDPNPQEDRDH